MKTLLKGGYILTDKGFEENGVFAIASKLNNKPIEKVISCDDFFIMPGFVDVHVHLREPGFSYKETIATGTRAAARGGFTVVCSMPNLKPAPTNLANLQKQLDIIEKDAVVKVIPYGAITSNQSGRGDLSEMKEMAEKVVAFTDDGKGVQNRELMREAMLEAKKLNKIIVAHCEDEGYDTYDPKSEYLQVERDIELARETGCPYHICHISTKETVELVRKAKKEGVDVTCETTPHYLVFDNENLPDEGRFKMNPPIRTKEDKDALIEGIIDGTIDMIATDHAPHSHEEKSKGFKDSMFGIVGLETAFSVLYTKLVKTKIIKLEKLVELMSVNPAKRFEISNPGYVIVDLKEEVTIDSDEFISLGKSSPFDGMDVYGTIICTVVDGEIV